MESVNPHDDARAAAARLNHALAHDLGRLMQWRLTVAIVLATVGVGLIFAGRGVIFTPPCLLGAAIALLLYFAVRAQLREVEARDWASPTPRISRLRTGPRSQSNASAVEPK